MYMKMISCIGFTPKTQGHELGEPALLQVWADDLLLCQQLQINFTHFDQEVFLMCVTEIKEEGLMEMTDLSSVMEQDGSGMRISAAVLEPNEKHIFQSLSGTHC